MIGIVLVTHGKLAEALIETAELILTTKPEAVIPVSITINEDVDKLRGKIIRAIKAVNRKQGILILTDMFGGTPSNLSYSLMEEGQVEVLSGVNLPILIKAVNSRDKLSLVEIAQQLEAYGKKSISLASGILKGQRRT